MNGWARNSRFWMISPWFVLLSAALAIYFDEPNTFIAITGPWMMVAGGKSIASTYRSSEPVDFPRGRADYYL